jgi:hypothetical protein
MWDSSKYGSREYYQKANNTGESSFLAQPVLSKTKSQHKNSRLSGHTFICLIVAGKSTI